MITIQGHLSEWDDEGSVLSKDGREVSIFELHGHLAGLTTRRLYQEKTPRAVGRIGAGGMV